MKKSKKKEVEGKDTKATTFTERMMEKTIINLETKVGSVAWPAIFVGSKWGICSSFSQQYFHLTIVLRGCHFKCLCPSQ